MRYYFYLSIFSIVHLIGMPANAKGNLSSKSHVGRAYADAEKKQLVYIERHNGRYKKGRIQHSVNEYFDTNNRKIAELVSDYSKSLEMPTYVFRDLRTGYSEGLRLEGGKYYIFKKYSGKSEDKVLVGNKNNVFSCQGWHYYILNNLKKFANNELRLKLVIPSRLDIYNFKIRQLDVSSNIAHLRLEFDSWIFRLFAPNLDLYYDTKNRRLVKYYGPSNIESKDGEVQNVHIFYE